MQQRELVSGFTELKDLLIRTYGIERRREFVRLYFTLRGKVLLMHDYDDHKKEIVICSNIEEKIVGKGLGVIARRVVKESLRRPSPTAFLIQEFQLNGFFRS